MSDPLTSEYEARLSALCDWIQHRKTGEVEVYPFPSQPEYGIKKHSSIESALVYVQAVASKVSWKDYFNKLMKQKETNCEPTNND